MSFDGTWNVDQYRDIHESNEHWELRKAFIVKWKDNFPEERLICLARVFCNIEILGCRYPAELMKEVALLSKEVAHSYRARKREKLQRTFVSASDAAVDRARGVKRVGGIVKETPPQKSYRINFVRQGESDTIESSVNHLQDSDNEFVDPENVEIVSEVKSKHESTSGGFDSSSYLNELLKLQCIDVNRFRDNMFVTYFGRFVLLIRPWTSKLGNIQASCQACEISLDSTYGNKTFTIHVNKRELAQGHGENKQAAKQAAEALAWDRIKTQVISVLVKEQWIAQGDARIGLEDVAGRSAGDSFGTAIESSVASKMMQMMGWKGGGLGADSQGIAEPVKPHLQMVNRAGLGSSNSDIRTLKRLAHSFMERYISTSSLDVDLVFSSEFSKEERAALHQCAQRHGLASRSYGTDADRFLVVKKKLNPFSIVKAALEEGGNTAKYQVFIPVALNH